MRLLVLGAMACGTPGWKVELGEPEAGVITDRAALEAASVSFLERAERAGCDVGNDVRWNLVVSGGRPEVVTMLSPSDPCVVSRLKRVLYPTQQERVTITVTARRR